MEKKEENDKRQLMIAIGIFVAILLIGVAAKLFLSKSGTDAPPQKSKAAEQTVPAQDSSQEPVNSSKVSSEEVTDNGNVPVETGHTPQEEELPSDTAMAEEEEEEETEESDHPGILANEYILPYSDSQYYSEEDLEQLTREQLRIARNEIYARKGRKFKDKELHDYFSGCSWYKGSIEPDRFKEDLLNQYENANKDLIAQYEQKKGYR